MSPPEGFQALGWYQVIGHIRNLGNSPESFNIRATVYDTTNWTTLFDQTTILVDLPPGADTNIDFGSVNFNDFSYFCTRIYTLLIGDENTANDTSVVYTKTDNGYIIFEMDVQAICNDNHLLGVEFDGVRFYITGGNRGTDPNKVYVVDATGTLLWSLDQPSHATGWGWRDLAWDGVYSGPDRIDTLYASVNNNVDKFSIDLAGGSLIYHGSFPGAENPNRALAFRPDSTLFYTANWTSHCYKFNKLGVILQSVQNNYSIYGAAYDTLFREVYWHSQDDPGTGFDCQISRMDAYTMNFLGTPFGFPLPSGLTDGVAGGLCSGYAYPWGCILYALVQGTPHDYIVGFPAGWIDNENIRSVSEENKGSMAKINDTSATIFSGPLRLPEGKKCKVFDITGRVVEPERIQPGIYFIEVDGVVTQKVVKVR
jgi:hypothetical protein